MDCSPDEIILNFDEEMDHLSTQVNTTTIKSESHQPDQGDVDFMEGKPTMEESDLEFSDDSESEVSEVEVEVGEKKFTVNEAELRETEFDGTDLLPKTTVNELDDTKIELLLQSKNLPECLPMDSPIVPLGKIFAITGPYSLIIESNLKRENSHKKNSQVFDEDTILVLEDRTVVGTIFEPFGPVTRPLYLVRFPKPCQSTQSDEMAMDDVDQSKDATKLEEGEEVKEEMGEVKVKEEGVKIEEEEDVDIKEEKDITVNQEGDVSAMEDVKEEEDVNLKIEDVSVMEDVKQEEGGNVKEEDVVVKEEEGANVKEDVDVKEEEEVSNEIVSSNDPSKTSQVIDPPTKKYHVGQEIFYAPEVAKIVPVAEILKFKGTDASNQNDEEVDSDEMEFSDDEKEREYHSRRRSRKRTGSAHPSRANSRSNSVTPAHRNPPPPSRSRPRPRSNSHHRRKIDEDDPRHVSSSHPPPPPGDEYSRLLKSYEDL